MQPAPEYNAEAEVELLRRVGQGDKEAFAQLYEIFAGVLYTTATRVLNNPQAAEDVLQEVFVQIWEKAPLYDPSRGKPLTWAITLTRNRSIDRLRSIQRQARLRDQVEAETQTLEKFDEHDSLDAVKGVERAETIRRAIGKLSTEQREAIELAFFKGLTQTEIAEFLEEPLGTVKARIRRGMMRLRDLIEPLL